MKQKAEKKTRKVLKLILFVAVFFTGCANSPADANSQDSEINRDMVPQPYDIEDLVAPVQAENTDQISRENFDKIKIGMSQLDVELIILGNSTLISSKEVDGILYETYRWEAFDPPAYIEVKFVRDKVVAKSQKGLL